MSERGHGRRCEQKIRYRTRREALEARATQMKRQDNPPPHQHEYRCRVCRCWHLTSQPNDPRPPEHPAGGGGPGPVEMEEVHMSKIYRQGDVLLARVDEAPEGRRVRPERGRLILARGEVTGHHHSVAVEDAELIEVAGVPEVFLRVFQTTTLDHQEHGSVTLPAGDYAVRRQREYVPQELPRQVAD